MEFSRQTRKTPAEIAPEVVRKHLRLVLAHGEFADSPQLAAFLTYVVERKLEGAEDRIKAYAIATEALGRPPSFDPQNDPIVRVQAKRLRQALTDSIIPIPTPMTRCASPFRLAAMFRRSKPSTCRNARGSRRSPQAGVPSRLTLFIFRTRLRRTGIRPVVQLSRAE